MTNSDKSSSVVDMNNSWFKPYKDAGHQFNLAHEKCIYCECPTVFLFEDEDIAASMDDGTDVIKCPLCTNDVFYNISNSTISNVGQRKWRSFNSTDCMGRDPQMQIDRKLVEDAAKMLDRLCVALPIPSAKSGKFRELRGQASVVRAKISVALLKGILYDAD